MPARLTFACNCRTGVERRLGASVGHQFDAVKQAAPTDVADVGVRAEPSAQELLETRAAGLHLGQQVVALDHALHRERGRAGDRVTEVGVAVLEEAAARAHRVDDLLLREHGADRLEAAAQALGDRDQIRDDAFLRARVQRPRATHPAHHLVEDEQHAVPVADLPHRLEVTGHRYQHAGRRPADSLGDEGEHGVRACRDDRLLELGGEPPTVVLRRLVVPLVAVGIARCDVGDVDQQRAELCPSPCIAADRECPQRIAVVGLAGGR